MARVVWNDPGSVTIYYSQGEGMPSWFTSRGGGEPGTLSNAALGTLRWTIFREGDQYKAWNPTTREVILVFFVMVPFSPSSTLPVPKVIRGVPQHIWSKPRNNAAKPWAMSMHVDQMRWAVAWIYATPDGTRYDIPLIDSSARPYFSTELPPLCHCRKSDGAGTDRVDEAWTASTKWWDAWSNLRPTTELSPGPTSVWWGLYIEREPVAHWVIRMIAQTNSATATTNTYRFDLFGTGGEAPSTTYEVGSSGTAGHYKIRLPWTQQAFNSAGSASVLNERAYGRGAIYVASDSGPGPTAGRLWLTTGANQGTITGTNMFGTLLPAVFVLAHEDANTDVTASAETAWKPDTWGMGFYQADSYNYQNALDPDRQYATAVGYLSAATRPFVDIYNTASGGTYDRTFFAHAIGKAV